MNKCSGCGKNFGSLNAFDMHRIGKFEPKTEDERRRCMTTEEMLSAGMRLVNEKWRGPADESNHWAERKKEQAPLLLS